MNRFVSGKAKRRFSNVNFLYIYFLFVLENTWFQGFPQIQNEYCKNLDLLKSDSESENLDNN